MQISGGRLLQAEDEGHGELLREDSPKLERQHAGSFGNSAVQEGTVQDQHRCV